MHPSLVAAQSAPRRRLRALGRQMAEAQPATIAVRVRRIEPQVEYTINASPEVRSRTVAPARAPVG